MKTHEQIVSEWRKEVAVGKQVVTNDELVRLCRRVAEEQRERDARIADEAVHPEDEYPVRHRRIIAAAIRQQEQHDEQ